ncbi:MAG TPA: AMP-binding protein [Gaiellaceae bacterium]
MASEHAARTVTCVLEEGAARHGDTAALRLEGTTTTYGELRDRAYAFAGGLERLGLARGDRLLIMAHNSLEFLDAWLGCALAGVVEVPVHVEYRGELLRYIVEHSAATRMLLAPEFVPRIAELAPELGALEGLVVLGDAPDAPLPTTTLAALLDGPPAAELEPLGESEPIAVMYTSGTTGPQKGVLVSHRHAYEYANAVARVLELREGDRYYAPLPLFHIAGQWAVVYACLQRGATAVVRRRFSVSEFWDDCAAEGVTTTFLLGAMAQFLYAQDTPLPDGVRLDRALLVPLIDGLDDFRSRFGVRVTTCYGSTETGVPVIAGFDVSDPTVIGRAAPGYELRIGDENDEEVPVGEAGELLVRTAEPWTTMIGYHGDDDATAHAFRNLWLHSGDAVRRDAGGTYYFVDRLKDAIRRRGENISSFDVEREVNAFQGVLESAAFAVPSEHTEDEVAVCVVPKPGLALDGDELRAFLEQRLPRFMLPSTIEVLPELPKTMTGKIKKYELRERVVAAHVR